MDFVVAALPAEIVSTVRRTRLSPGYRHPVTEEPAKGYGPCRACLGVFETGGDRRLLFTYNPFDGLGPIPSPGPVFIHSQDCDRFESDGFPQGLRQLPLFFEAYRHDGSIGARCRVSDAEIEPTIESMFADGDVAFIHIRNFEAGCFIARIDRSVAAT